MGKGQIKVDLVFGADTSRAKQSLADLQQQLNQFNHAMASNTNFKISDDIRDAQVEMAKLNVALKESVNTSTGKFDLSKFDQSLKKSGTSLNQLKNKFMATGAEGQKAFLSLTNSIMSAEIPLRRNGKLLSDFADTLKKTAKWQISSSIYRGFTGALQSAYGYAQDLNKSLNDIRIVTGYDTQYMAKFAKEANKAAKALSATTNEYAKASLIYFQQGLSDKDVAKRTATTIKLANVTGESAENVSSYMTAVWNNFDNGTKSLEYYADAITALGAATASSSEEIATGLQKFSAVANTVGLSYEYATAALATVTAQTRESAETVGTAFKTIFARLESLSLGETLDDDTNMTKYSQALAKVGVNIKNAEGELKNMDTIIDELGSKWNNINKDQQVALAQTVAGMRQYNNFIALMDNYKTFSSNVDIATSSTGTLDKQSKIYAENWEAARDRVKAAAEGIYDDILDDETFIKILNTFEKLLTGVDKFIESLGGLKTILPMLSTLLLRVFNTQVSEGINNMAYAVKRLTGVAGKEAMDIKKKAYDLAKNLNTDTANPSSTNEAEVEGQKRILDIQNLLLQNEDKLNARQKAVLNEMIKQVETENTYNTALAKRVDLLQEEISLEEKRVLRRANKEKQQDVENAIKDRQTFMSQVESGDFEGIGTAINEYKQGSINITELKEKLKAESHSDALTSTKTGQQIAQSMSKLYQSLEGKNPNQEAAIRQLEEMSSSAGLAQRSIDNLYLTLEDTGAFKSSEDFEKYIQTLEDGELATKRYTDASERSNGAVQRFVKEIEDADQDLPDLGNTITGLATGMTSLITASNALSNAWSTLWDPDVSGWEKLLTVLTTFTTVIPTVVMGWNALKEANVKHTFTKIIDTLATKLNTDATKKNAAAKREEAAATREATDEQVKETASDVGDTIVDEAKDKLDDDNGGSKFNFKDKINKVKEAPGKIKTGWKDFKGGFQKTANAKGWKIGAKGASSGVQAAPQAANAVTGAAGTGATSGAGVVGTGGAVGAGGTTTGGGLAASLGSVAAVAIPIVIAVAAIAAAIAGTIAMYQAAEKSAKRAEAAAESAKQVAEEAKQAYSDTVSQISGYEDAAKGLSELTKGTQEWRDAMFEANAQAKELISKHGDKLSAGDYYFEDGQIKFKEGVLEKLQEEEFNEMMKAQAGADAAQIIANDARNNADNVAYARKHVDAGGNDAEAWKNVGIQVGGGLAAGAAIGSIFGPWGALIGAGIGTLVGVASAAITTAAAGTAQENELQALDALGEAYRKDSALVQELEKAKQEGRLSELLAEKQIDADVSVVEALLKNSDKLEEHLMGLAENSNQNRLLRESIVANSNAGNEAYEKSTNQEYLNVFGANAMEDTESERYKDTFAQVEKELSTSKEQFWKDYVKEVYGDAEGKQYRIQNWDGKGVTLQKWDEDAKTWVTDEALGKDGLSIEDAKKTLTQTRMGTLSDEEIERYEREAESIQASITKAGVKNADYVYQAGLDFIKGNEIDLSKVSYAEITKLNIEAIRKENAELAEALKVAERNSKESWNKALYAYSLHVGQTMAMTDNMTLEGLNNLTSAMSKVSSIIGQEGAGNINDYVQSIISMYPQKANEIAEIMNQIDWSQGGDLALIQMETALRDLGVNVNKTSAAWQDMANSVNNIKASILGLDIDKFRKEVVSLDKVIKGLSFGEVISDEDFANLEKYAEGARDLFIKTAEGYEYLGDNTDLSDVVQQSLGKQAQGYLKDLRTAKSAQDTNKLNKALTASEWGDMEIVATSSAYAAFREAYQMNPEQLKDMAAKGREAEKVLNDAKAGRVKLDDEDKAKWEKQLEAAQELSNLMYTNAENLASRDFDQEMRDRAEVTVSQYDSIAQLKAAEADWITDPILKEAYQKRLEQLEKESQLRIKEIDTLHGLKRELNTIEKAYDKVSKMKDRAYGAEKLDYMRQEQELLEAEMENYEDSWSKAKLKQAETQNDLIAKASDLGVSLQFDEVTGELANYEEVIRAANASWSADQVSDLDNLISTYEEAIDSVGDYENKLLETKNATEDLFLEYLDYTIEINIELNEAGLKYLEKQLEKLQDDSFTAAEQMSNLLQQGNKYYNNYSMYKAGIQTIAQENGIETEGKSFDQIYGEILTSDEISDQERQKVKDYYGEMENAYESLLGTEKQWHEAIVGYFEDTVEVYDKFAEKAGNVNKVISDFKNISNIVGEGLMGLDMKAFTKDMANATKEVSIALMGASQNTLASLERDRSDLLAKIQATNSEEEKKEYEKDLETIDKMIVDAGNNVRQHWADALQAATDAFSASVEQAAADFEKAMAGAYGTMDRMQQVFDQKTNISQQYLADYKKIYELSKLTRQIENKIDNASSVKAKQSLAELQKEINALEANGVEMSQYDLEYLQKRYELRLAEIALEDQQNAKSQVRLTKLADGSWGYLYTKNMDDAESAMQSYEDALYAAQETTDNYLNNLASSIISIQSEAADAITAVWNDASLTMEERQKQADELAAYYTEQMRYYTSEYDKAVSNNYSLYTIDWMNFSAFTGQKIKSAKSFNTTFDETILGSMKTYAASAKGVYETFNTSLGSAPGEGGEGSGLLGALYSASSNYKSEVDSIFATAGTTLSGYAQNVYDTMGIGADGAESGEGGLIPSLREAFDYASETLENQKLLDAIGNTWDKWYGTTGSGGFKDKVEAVETDIERIGNMLNDASLFDSSGTAYLDAFTTAIETWRNSDAGLKGVINRIKTDVSGMFDQIQFHDSAVNKINAAGYNGNTKGGGAWTDKNNKENWSIDELLSAGSGDDMPPLSTLGYHFWDMFINPNSSSALTDTEWESLGLDVENKNIIHDYISKRQYEEAGQHIQDSGVGAAIRSYIHGDVSTEQSRERAEARVDEDTHTGGDLGEGTLKLVKLTDEGLKKFKYGTSLFEDTDLGSKVQRLVNGQILHAMSGDYGTVFGAKMEELPGQNTEFTIEDTIGDYYVLRFHRAYDNQTFTDENGYPFLIHKSLILEEYDTGGYTGAWGPEGRLAMLHQKEIVLNASDTENMLAAVDILRQVVQQIDLQAAAASHSLFAQAPSITSTGDTLQQEVTIHAEFPNATNHSEIEEAFDTLINRAAQYTNRKRY